jgi:hypothetical protein
MSIETVRWRPICGGLGTGCDRLSKLDTISFRIGDPADKA